MYHRDRSAVRLSAAAGVLDSVANLLLLLAARRGEPAVVAVISALLPAGTVLLARGVLTERIHRGRLVGPGTAVVAVSLLALTRPAAPLPPPPPQKRAPQ